MVNKTLTINLPKGYVAKSYTATSGNPVGKTSFKFRLRKGRLILPFRYVKIVDGTKWKLKEVKNFNGVERYIFKI